MKKLFLAIIVVTTLTAAYLFATEAGEKSRAARQERERLKVRQQEAAAYGQRVEASQDYLYKINANTKSIGQLKGSVNALIRQVNLLQRQNKILTQQVMVLKKTIEDSGIKAAKEPNTPDAAPDTPDIPMLADENDSNDPNI